MIRENIYAALFALASTATGFNYKSRIYKTWDDISPVDQPSLLQLQRSEKSIPSTNLGTTWELRVDLVIYAHTKGDTTTPASTVLNPIIDAVVNKIQPNQNHYAVIEETLGGLVHRCRVDGSIEIFEGNQGGQGVAVIPIVMVVPE